MHDTTREMEQLWRTQIMERSSEERFLMGISMYDTAKSIVRASLSSITDSAELKVVLFNFFYGADFSEEEMCSIVAWFRATGESYKKMALPDIMWVEM